MPRFQLTGVGRKTLRKRVRVYEADDLEHALQLAFNDETIVEVAQTKILPDIPASENQVRYATELGLQFPKTISKKEMSNLLSDALKQEHYQRINAQLPPTEAQIELVKEKGFSVPTGITRRKMVAWIDQIIEDEYQENFEDES